MRRSRIHFGHLPLHHLLLGWCVIALAHGFALAQSESAAPEATTESPRKPATVEESPLTTFVFRDADGKLVEVPNFSFEDFLEAQRTRLGLTQQDPRPRFSIQWLSLVGEATQDHAEMLLTARVLVRDAHWVRVPLRLDQAMVREPLETTGEVEAFLHPETEGEGYVCYLRGEPDEQYTIKIKLLVPLSTVGGRTQLALRLPRATASEMKLGVPVSDVVAEVSEGTTLLPPNSSPSATDLTVLGVVGDFQLSWSKPETDVAAVPVVLQADGAVSARMDGQTVTWNAAISVRSFGAPFNRFQLRLPPHSVLVAGSPSGYSITPGDRQEEDAPLGRLVEVQLDKKTSGPVEVQVAARRALDEGPQDNWVDLAGFAVVDAVRQWGHLAVAVPNDWQVLWGAQRGMNRIELLPEPLRQENIEAGFEYSMQPAMLQARLVPKTTRLSVEPEYLVLAGPEQVELQARLRYSIRGAKVFALHVGLPGWQVDTVGPDNLIALDGVESAENGDLHIPLLQPTRGDLEIVISAHRVVPAAPADAEGASMEVQLPRPHTDTSGTGVLIVLPDDNVGLTLDSAKTVGLVRQATAPTMSLPPRQQPPMYFRTELPKAVFAASIRRLSRRIEVDVASHMILHSEMADVRQRLNYSVQHEPTESFLLQVPAFLAASDDLKILHDGLAVPARPIESKAPVDGGPVMVQVDLPEACIGDCELTLSYSVPLPSFPERGSVTASIPLIVPHQAVLGIHRLTLEERGDMFAEVADATWRRSVDAEASVTPPAEPVAYFAEGPQSGVALRIGPPDSLRDGTTVVERAWVQSWLIRTDRSDRQDRAVFEVRTPRKRLDVQLPQGSSMDQLFVWLDHERVENYAVDGTRVQVPLPGDGSMRSYHLELGYHFLEPMDRQGLLSIELPRLGEKVWVRRMYWQLVLPRHEHLIVAPEGFTSESPWNWAGYLFVRTPLLEQPDLEQWSNAPARTPVSQDTNRYLFGTSGYPEGAVLRTASRSWIVLGASGLALIVGLVLIYVPAGRHPGTLFVIAVGLACTGALYPAPTVLVAQAASLGLGLTLLAGLLERSVARRRGISPASGVVRGPDGDSTLTQHNMVNANDPTTTQASPVGVGSASPQDAFS